MASAKPLSSVEGKTEISNQLCDFCAREIPVKYCQDCEDRLCETCEKGHGRNKYMIGHKVVDISVSKVVYCETHPDCALDFSCTNCKAVICETCKAGHPGHKIEGIKGDDVRKLQKLCTDTIPDLLHLGNDLENDKTVCENVIQEYTKLEDVLECNKIDIVEIISNRMSELQVGIREKKENLEAILKDKESGLETCIDKCNLNVKLLSDIRTSNNLQSLINGLKESNKDFKGAKEMQSTYKLDNEPKVVSDILPNIGEFETLNSSIKETIDRSRNQIQALTLVECFSRERDKNNLQNSPLNTPCGETHKPKSINVKESTTASEHITDDQCSKPIHKNDTNIDSSKLQLVNSNKQTDRKLSGNYDQDPTIGKSPSGENGGCCSTQMRTELVVDQSKVSDSKQHIPNQRNKNESSDPTPQPSTTRNPIKKLDLKTTTVSETKQTIPTNTQRLKASTTQTSTCNDENKTSPGKLETESRAIDIKSNKVLITGPLMCAMERNNLKKRSVPIQHEKSINGFYICESNNIETKNIVIYEKNTNTITLFNLESNKFTKKISEVKAFKMIELDMNDTKGYVAIDHTLKTMYILGETFKIVSAITRKECGKFEFSGLCCGKKNNEFLFSEIKDGLPCETKIALGRLTSPDVCQMTGLHTFQLPILASHSMMLDRENRLIMITSNPFGICKLDIGMTNFQKFDIAKANDASTLSLLTATNGSILVGYPSGEVKMCNENCTSWKIVVNIGTRLCDGCVARDKLVVTTKSGVLIYTKER